VPDSDTLTRRQWLQQIAGLALLTAAAPDVRALMASDSPLPQTAPVDAGLALTAGQMLAVRQWFQLIVSQQLSRGPTPRWQQHDCVGLVRFATGEALRAHDPSWLRANGLLGRQLPPEPALSAAQLAALRHLWWRADGQQGAYVGAMELVQYNCRYIGRDVLTAQPADLLLFDQGQAQHVMIWMGQYIAYHTGTVTPSDNGLRAYSLDTLMNWKDTRWQPQAHNPNFLGLFRLRLLSAP
jgi:uncharacterized protein YfaT (DUF1175 family)